MTTIAYYCVCNYFWLLWNCYRNKHCFCFVLLSTGTHTLILTARWRSARKLFCSIAFEFWVYWVNDYSNLAMMWLASYRWTLFDGTVTGIQLWVAHCMDAIGCLLYKLYKAAAVGCYRCYGACNCFCIALAAQTAYTLRTVTHFGLLGHRTLFAAFSTVTSHSKFVSVLSLLVYRIDSILIISFILPLSPD